MATQFKYQAGERVTGPSFAIAEDWARIDLNLDGQFEIILPASRQRQAGDIEVPARIYRYDPVTGLVPVDLRDSTGAVLTTSWVQDMIVGDFNRDGRADLLIGDHGGEQPAPTGHVGGRLQLWTSSAAGPIVSVVSEALGQRGFWHATGAADFNRDGALDVLTVNLAGEFIPSILGTAIFLNNGQGRFTLSNGLVPSTASVAQNRNSLTSTVAAGDVDRDGFADLVWGAGADGFNNPPTPREVRVYFGQTTGLTNSYVSLPFANIAGVNPISLAADKLRVADFNGDGLMDVSVLLTSNATTGRWGQVFLQGPNRTFTEVSVFANNVAPQYSSFGTGDGILAVDVNNDGLPDIHFATNATTNFNQVAATTYINMGDGSYRSLESLAPNLWAEPGLAASWSRWGDLDGDGQAELFGTRFISGTAANNTIEFFSSRLTVDALQVTNGPLTGTIFAEVITGTAGPDSIDGWLGSDTINAGSGDDVIAGGVGNDRIDGGAGTDTAVYAGRKADYTVRNTGGTWTVTDDRGGSPEGTDTLVSIEFLQFSDGRSAIAVTPPKITVPAGLATAMNNILRAEPSSPATYDLAANLVARMASGQTLAQVTAEVVKAADATTSVATLAYQFFTGKIPGQGGIDYLVSPTGPNPNNLNSPYYQSFNIENRFINFAVNLGKNGDGAAQFQAAYGTKTLSETVKGAYATIFGSTPTDAKVAALLAGGRDAYFAAYGLDGLTGIGTKAAAVGWLLAEAAKADIGMYSKANDAFLLDLADGATFAVDLIGTYGKPEFNFTG